MLSRIGHQSMNEMSRIVFFSKMAQAVPSIGPVQRESGGMFVSNRKETLRFFSTNYPALPKKLYRSWLGPLNPGKKLLQNANIIVSGARHRKILGTCHAKRAMLFHGTYRYLTQEHLQELKAFDYVFLNGPRMEVQLKRLNASLDCEIRTCGYAPFVDFPDPTVENPKRILEKLNLDVNARLVFYAPARRDCGSWMECAEAIAAEVPSELNLVMRPHPNQALHGTSEERKLYSRLSARLDARGRAVIDLGTCSFPELMSAADLLIGDATSPNEEFMLFDRPQIITETHTREQWVQTYQQMGMHPDDIADLLGLYSCAFSFKRGGFRDWGHAIEHALAHADEHSRKRRDYFEYAFGKDARTAAGRIAEELLRIT